MQNTLNNIIFGMALINLQKNAEEISDAAGYKFSNQGEEMEFQERLKHTVQNFIQSYTQYLSQFNSTGKINLNEQIEDMTEEALSTSIKNIIELTSKLSTDILNNNSNYIKQNGSTMESKVRAAFSFILQPLLIDIINSVKESKLNYKMTALLILYSSEEISQLLNSLKTNQLTDQQKAQTMNLRIMDVLQNTGVLSVVKKTLMNGASEADKNKMTKALEYAAHLPIGEYYKRLEAIPPMIRQQIPLLAQNTINLGDTATFRGTKIDAMQVGNIQDLSTNGNMSSSSLVNVGAEFASQNLKETEIPVFNIIYNGDNSIKLSEKSSLTPSEQEHLIMERRGMMCLYVNCVTSTGIKRFFTADMLYGNNSEYLSFISDNPKIQYFERGLMSIKECEKSFNLIKSESETPIQYFERLSNYPIIIKSIKEKTGVEMRSQAGCTIS
jgi:hypothetical protein